MSYGLDLTRLFHLQVEVVAVEFYSMSSEFFIFKVHFRGKFNRKYRCSYVGGDTNVYDEPYDPELLSFFKI